MPNVLVVLADGFEEIEAITPIDVLRRAGAMVEIAALGDDIHVTGKNGVTVHADTVLTAVQTRDYDCVLLPGGPGTKKLRADPRVRTVLQRHHVAGKILAAICAAPTVFHDAGLLKGRSFTAHHSVAAELPEALGDVSTILDGKIVTSRGAGTALEFGLVLIEQLFSTPKRHEIATSIASEV